MPLCRYAGLRRDLADASTVFRALVAIALAVGMIASLGGCEKTRQAFGMTKSAPDEFAVVTSAPLVIPPDYGLRPPTPGARRPQEASTRSEARGILLRSGSSGRQGGPGGKAPSQGEVSLLSKAGAGNADPSIRDKVSRESSVLAESDTNFMTRLMFWQEEEPPGTILDADKESRRIRENAALGDMPVKGTTPVIERREKGFLEGIFN